MADERPPAPADAPRRHRGFTERLVSRSQLIAYTIFVLAILVVANIIADRHDKSWDLTTNQRYSLSPESKKIVRDLKQPLKIVYFDRESEFGHARDFLERYQRASNKVAVDYVDPVRHPDLAQQYNVRTYGTVVLVLGREHQNVDQLSEQNITNALVRMLKGGAKNVYFVLGDGERDTSDSGQQGYSEFKTALTQEDFTVKNLMLPQSPKIPADCSVLVIAGPQHPMVQPEVQAIMSYLDGGGRVFFMLSPGINGPLVDTLQSQLNVNLPDNIVVDESGVGRLFGASPVMPIAIPQPDNPITKQMGQVATLFNLTRSVDPASNPASKATVTALVKTAAASFAPPYQPGTRISLNPATAAKGPFVLAVSGTLSGAGSAEPRFAIYGTADVGINALLNFEGNRDLLLNTMNWLSQQEAFITIRPKPQTNAPVNLSAGQMRAIMIAVLAVLPGLIMLAGVIVWLDRRRA